MSTALDRARVKAHAARVGVDFVHADATRLRCTDLGTDFTLILDNGCLHGMSEDHRDRYVREVTAAAAPNARLLIVAFGPGGQFGVRGIDQAEIERRFTPAWSPLFVGQETAPASGGNRPVRYYLLQRRN